MPFFTPAMGRRPLASLYPFLKTSALAVLCLVGMGQMAAAQCPVAAGCTPGRATSASAQFIQAGIFSVTIGSGGPFASSGYAEGYRDNSCTLGVALPIGVATNVRIQTGSSVQENVRVYLDANNDGRLDSLAELVYSSNAATVHTGTITVPVSAPAGQRLRLRIASDAIASALPGPCRTPEYSQTEDYFIQTQANTSLPVADFFSADSLTCSTTVNFTDRSSGGATGYSWDFGDGQQGSGTGPQHTYTASGIYTVRLIVRNANGADTLVRPGYIRINDTVPATASCQPVTSQYCCNYGITRVAITPALGGPAVFDNPSANASVGYEDFTCRIRGRLVEGKRYRLALTTNPAQAQATRVWLDTSANGAFEAGELIYSTVSAISPVDTFMVPSLSASRLGQPLRLRILSDVANANLTPCTNPQLGQAEDYTVFVVANTLPPVADFRVNSGSNCLAVRGFTSRSENSISRYIWLFGDGGADSTSGPTVSHIYPREGTYTVSLIVAGPYGRDTARQLDAVVYTVAPVANTCSTPTINSCCGIGIFRVTLGQIDYSSGDALTEGYQDNVCNANTTLTIGQPTPITVVTGTNNPETVKIWLDSDNSGFFDQNEQLAVLAPVPGVHTGSITINNAPLGVPLRLRIVSYGGNQAGGVQCTGVRFGQAEDYGVIMLANRQPPVAAFGASSRVVCNGAVRFIDSSVNAPTSYRWSFGDGGTSNIGSITHIYRQPGVYTVKLVVRNANGVDSLTRTDFITVRTPIALAPVVCLPQTVNNCCGFGITNVLFGQIDKTSPAGEEGYKDYTCGNTAVLRADSTVALSVTTGGPQAELVRAWIDYNSDGNFDDATELVMNQSATGLHLAQVRLASSALAGALRMRVMSDVAQGPVFDACTSPRVGQAEDYSVVIQAIAAPPVANFVVRGAGQICTGYATFTDSSRNGPTRYRYDFGDGQSDTVASPVHYYAAAGTYTVQQIVTNAFGSDTLVRTDYIVASVPNGLLPASCTPTYTTPATNSGITRLVLGTYTNNSLNSQTAGSYEDFACAQQLPNLEAGQTVTISITTPGNQYVSAFIDYNNDGQLAISERVLASTANTFIHTGTFIVPGNVQVDTALRLRLVAVLRQPGGSPQAPAACGAYTSGQVEDYLVRILALPPVARPTILSSTTCMGTVRFADSSRGGVTSRSWDFGDGSQLSALANPTHRYTAAGSYTVRLIVNNALGTDTSLTQVTILAVNGGPAGASCAPQTVNVRGTSGPTRVQLFNSLGLLSIDQASGFSSEGYRDFTCEDSVQATRGSRVSFSVTTVGQSVHRLYWLADLNEDGVFNQNTEILAQSLNVTGTVVGGFTVPTNSLRAGNRKIRLRLQVSVNQGPGEAPGQCTVTNGQAEDYTLAVVDSVIAIAVAPRLAIEGLRLEPNPASGSVRLLGRLTAGAAARPMSLLILDGLGRTVLTHKLAGQTDMAETLDIAALPPGLYQVSLSDGKGRETRRLIVQ